MYEALAKLGFDTNLYDHFDYSDDNSLLSASRKGSMCLGELNIDNLTPENIDVALNEIFYSESNINSLTHHIYMVVDQFSEHNYTLIYGAMGFFNARVLTREELEFVEKYKERRLIFPGMATFQQFCLAYSGKVTHDYLMIGGGIKLHKKKRNMQDAPVIPKKQLEQKYIEYIEQKIKNFAFDCACLIKSLGIGLKCDPKKLRGINSLDYCKNLDFHIKNSSKLNEFIIQNQNTDLNTILDKTEEMFNFIKRFRLRTSGIISQDRQKRHTYIVAGSGHGKSELIRYLITKNHYMGLNVGLIDPHGDLATSILSGKNQIPKLDPDRIVYLSTDFNNEIRKHSRDTKYFDQIKELDTFGLFCINPLELPEQFKKDWQLIEDQADNIIKALAEIMNHDGDTVSKNMRTVLKPCLCALIHKENTTLFDLADFLGDDYEKYLSYAKNNCSEGQRRFFEKEFERKELDVTKNAIRNKLQSFFNSDIFTKILCGKTTVDLDSIISEEDPKKSKYLFINLAKDRTKGIATALGTFLFSSILNAAYRQKKTSKRGFFLSIDECQLVITESIGEALSESRKYGLHLTLANQYTDQIENRNIRQSVGVNTLNKFIGKSGGSTHRFLGDLVALDEAKKEWSKSPPKGTYLFYSEGIKGEKIIAPSFLVNDPKHSKEELVRFLAESYRLYYTWTKKQAKEAQKTEDNIMNTGRKTAKYSNF